MKPEIVAQADWKDGRSVELARLRLPNHTEYRVLVARPDSEMHAEFFTSYIIAAGTYLQHLDRLAGRAE